MTKKNIKISEVTGLLEELAIKNYDVHSHTYIKSNSAIRLEKITDYYYSLQINYLKIIFTI